MRTASQTAKYLIANPQTRTVTRRSVEPAGLQESHLMSLAVVPDVWKRYRAGDLVNVEDLSGRALSRWLEALDRVDKRKAS